VIGPSDGLADWSYLHEIIFTLRDSLTVQCGPSPSRPPARPPAGPPARPLAQAVGAVRFLAGAGERGVDVKRSERTEAAWKTSLSWTVMSLPFLNRTPQALQRTTECSPLCPRRHMGVVVVRQLKHDLTNPPGSSLDAPADFFGLGLAPSSGFAPPPLASWRAVVADSNDDAFCFCEGREGEEGGELGTELVPLALGVPLALSRAWRLASLRSSALMWYGWWLVYDDIPVGSDIRLGGTGPITVPALDRDSQCRLPVWVFARLAAGPAMVFPACTAFPPCIMFPCTIDMFPTPKSPPGVITPGGGKSSVVGRWLSGRVPCCAGMVLHGGPEMAMGPVTLPAPGPTTTPGPGIPPLCRRS